MMSSFLVASLNSVPGSMGSPRSAVPTIPLTTDRRTRYVRQRHSAGTDGSARRPLMKENPGKCPDSTGQPGR